MTDEAALQRAWSLCMGILPVMVAKALCELGVPDILMGAAQEEDKDPGAAQLSALQIVERLKINVERPPAEAADLLDRLMGCMCACGVFKATSSDGHVGAHDGHVEPHHAHVGGAEARPPLIKYGLTPVSRLLTGASLRDFLLFWASPTMILPTEYLSQYVVTKMKPPFKSAHSMGMWELAAAQPSFNALINAAMSSSSHVTLSAFLKHYTGLSHLAGGTLVDVGGGNGTAASRIAALHPSIRVINFDLPHVIANAPSYANVEHIEGDMFQDVPTGDAIFMKFMLHGWDDENCIKILKNCHKALSKHGKIIIMEIVLDATFTMEHSFNNVRGTFDIAMLSFSKGGKERTRQEWEYILEASNFRLNKIYDLLCPECVIEAFPY